MDRERILWRKDRMLVGVDGDVEVLDSIWVIDIGNCRNRIRIVP
jgi:hypothetical protein